MSARESSAAVDPAFWRGRRVLLTGHTGFKGAWLALWLQAMGAEVTGVAVEPTRFALTRVEERSSLSGRGPA